MLCSVLDGCYCRCPSNTDNPFAGRLLACWAEFEFLLAAAIIRQSQAVRSVGLLENQSSDCKCVVNESLVGVRHTLLAPFPLVSLMIFLSLT